MSASDKLEALATNPMLEEWLDTDDDGLANARKDLEAMATQWEYASQPSGSDLVAMEWVRSAFLKEYRTACSSAVYRGLVLGINEAMLEEISRVDRPLRKLC